MDPAFNSQSTPVTQNPTSQLQEKPKGFFKNVGGIAKKVVAPLGVEITTADTKSLASEPTVVKAEASQAAPPAAGQETPSLVVVNNPPEPAEEPSSVSFELPSVQSVEAVFSPAIDESTSSVMQSSDLVSVNILNDTVFKENPAEFLMKEEDGLLHLDKEKLLKAANKFLMDPQNLKKVIEANPHLGEELAESGILVPKAAPDN